MNTRSRRPRRAAATLIAALVLAGCGGPTRFTRTWTDADYEGGPLRRVAIFVMHRDPAVRKLAEDEAVKALPAGTRGAAGYALVSPATENDAAAVAAQLTRAGFDGVILSRFAGRSTVNTWIPPRRYRSLQGMTSFDYGYRTSWEEFRTPGHYEEEPVARVETRVYTLSPERMVWAGDSETFDPRSMREVVDSVVAAGVKALEAAGLLAVR
jgi:hypothetical protein